MFLKKMNPLEGRGGGSRLAERVANKIIDELSNLKGRKKFIELVIRPEIVIVGTVHPTLLLN